MSGSEQLAEKSLNFGEIRDTQSLRRTELVPFHVGQRLAVPGEEHADHFAAARGCGLTCGQPVSDIVADLDLIRWTNGIRHGASLMILETI